jgi:hypothetical protein
VACDIGQMEYDSLLPEEHPDIRSILTNQTPLSVAGVAKFAIRVSEDLSVSIAGNGIAISGVGGSGADNLTLAVADIFCFQHFVSPSEDCFLCS